jgi:hypothetical protein
MVRPVPERPSGRTTQTSSSRRRSAGQLVRGRTKVDAGAIPDVGERRSFPVPGGKGELAGHHVEQLRTHEVNVRVPKEQVSAAALPRLEIALYRMKEELRRPAPTCWRRRRSASSSTASCARSGA